MLSAGLIELLFPFFYDTKSKKVQQYHKCGMSFCVKGENWQSLKE
jgi:hypothetical protein